jgi:hypothetical protein
MVKSWFSLVSFLETYYTKWLCQAGIKISALKVNKNDNFFGFDFEFCTNSMLFMHNKILVKNFFDWTIMGGATIIPRSPKTTRNEKNFQDRPKVFYFLNHIW